MVTIHRFLIFLFFNVPLHKLKHLGSITKPEDFGKTLHMAVSQFPVASASLEVQKPYVQPASQVNYSKCLNFATSHTWPEWGMGQVEWTASSSLR